MGVGSVDESSQQKNGHTDAAASVSDLDEYRPYAWIYPDGVVRQDSESGDQDGQDDRRQAQLRVSRGEMELVIVNFVNDDDDKANPE